ncbi:MAG: LLM class F420-dependent oxidoreductase [Proteobacteria bacterium]|nr:LLM class F420-dependent oxidoreductase [Pseudomonadota bacterium]
MKFGLMPAYQISPVETAEYAAGLARLAEEVGFESVWAAEHVVMPAEYASTYPYHKSGRMPIPDAAVPDPLTWLTWVGAASERLLLGTAVAILPQHNPLVFAKTVASLDRLSGGRVILGVGLGWLEEESRALGIDFRTRAARCDESIEAMRALWTEPVASYRGEHVRFDAVKCSPRPLRPGGVPIHVGGHSRAAARRAGRLGDGFMPLGGSLEEMAPLRAIMEEAAREAGRDPAAIEITRLGAPDPEHAKACADAGVDRLIVHAMKPDLDGVRSIAEAFLGEVSR